MPAGLSDPTYATKKLGYVRRSGLTVEAEGKPDQATEAYLESARISPLFPTGYAHILTIAMQQARNSPETARRLLEQLEAAQPDRPAARQLLQRLFPGP